MANIRIPKTKEDLKKGSWTITRLKSEYLVISEQLMKILDRRYLLCPFCGEWLGAGNFDTSKRTATGREIICKDCLLKIATDAGRNEERIDNKKKAKKACRLIDIPYIDSLYENCIALAKEEDNGATAFERMKRSVKSLPQYRDMTYEDSEFSSNDEDMITEGDIPESVKKRFGEGFSAQDYKFLQDQYEDWTARTQVDSKSQELIIQRICFKQLDIWKAQKAGRETKDLDKSLNDLMASANLQPRQNLTNDSNDNLTFGQLLAKWEMDFPVPLCEPSQLDVDKLGEITDVFFKGALAKNLGLNNALSDKYSEYMEKYTIKKPEYQEEYEESNLEDFFGTNTESEEQTV